MFGLRLLGCGSVGVGYGGENGILAEIKMRRFLIRDGICMVDGRIWVGLRG